MHKVRIHIPHALKEGPWGGGHQFLKALRHALETRGAYTNTPERADIVLFNSFEDTKDLLRLKHSLPNTLFIHRVDGPVVLVRGKDRLLDHRTFVINNALADGTIFQSTWCEQETKHLGMQKQQFETIIMNAPDNTTFNANGSPQELENPIRLIAVSWSNNPRKGFHFYKELDDRLDFSTHQMTFVGRTPFTFKNITVKKAMPSRELAEELKRHHIFVTASQTEPCSNALIEALSCGLPAIALNSGGHPEILQEGGELFTDIESFFSALRLVRMNYTLYKSSLPVFDIHKVTDQYLSFATHVKAAQEQGTYKPKQLSIAKYTYIRLLETGFQATNMMRKIASI